MGNFYLNPSGEVGFLTLANWLTLLRFTLVPLLWITLLSSGLLYRSIGLFLFIIGALTDYWDGRAARKRGETTAWGNFMDPLADKLLVLSALWLILLNEDFGNWGGLAWGSVILITFREVALTLTRIWKIQHGSSLKTSLWGKLKTAVQLSAIILGLSLLIGRDITSDLPGWSQFWVTYPLALMLTILFLLSAVFSVISGLLYLKDAHGEV